MKKIFFILFLLTMTSLLGFQVLAEEGVDSVLTENSNVGKEAMRGQELSSNQEIWQKTHDRIVRRGERLGRRVEMKQEADRSYHMTAQ